MNSDFEKAWDQAKGSEKDVRTPPNEPESGSFHPQNTPKPTFVTFGTHSLKVFQHRPPVETVDHFVGKCREAGDEPVVSSLKPAIALKLISWHPTKPPIELTQGETVEDVERFVRSELAWLRGRLDGTNAIKVGPGIVESIQRLAAVGLRLELVVGKGGDDVNVDRLLQPSITDATARPEDMAPEYAPLSFEEWSELPLEEQRRRPWHFDDVAEIPF